jgi:hypothetical protein
MRSGETNFCFRNLLFCLFIGKKQSKKKRERSRCAELANVLRRNAQKRNCSARVRRATNGAGGTSAERTRTKGLSRGNLQLVSAKGWRKQARRRRRVGQDCAPGLAHVMRLLDLCNSEKKKKTKQTGIIRTSKTKHYTGSSGVSPARVSALCSTASANNRCDVTG